MDIRELDRRALATLDGLVAGIRTEDLTVRTPCEGWNLGDLLRHQVGENHSFAVAFRQGSDPDWGDGSLGENAYADYAESVRDYLAALEDDGLFDRQVTVGPAGTFPGKVAVAMHLVDSVAHGWDIAKALGLPYDPDPEAVAEALRVAERIPADPAARSAGGAFGPVVETSTTATPLEVFLALLGRSPDWS
jgi:uncharacterized protein (TIGR03086 family)